MKRLTCLFFLACTLTQANESALPTALDLRSAEGKSYVSAVKNQSGGTCWTHGAMAAIESNLMMTGTWLSNENGEANLAEYHLDWWNGFNQHHNGDIAPTTGGLTVHQGGDYRVAAAYFARGEGAVRDTDAQSYATAPAAASDKYHYFYVRDIEWFSAGANLQNINRIKQAIVDHGVIGTALTWSNSFYSNNTFYQPPTNSQEANHAVAIIGWDDAKATQAPKPGAWLVKNSWGTSWGNKGYFWISFYDKVAGQHGEMGAVSFNNVERMQYDHVYSHDYHGWRDTKKNVTEAFNKFTAKGASGGRETLKAVSFYTAVPNVEYTVRVYDGFRNGELVDQVSVREGVADNVGFHTVDLNWPVQLRSTDDFYVHVTLSSGGHPFDKTSNVPLLLGGSGRPIVASKASPGESFYKTSAGWVDLTKDDATANFCIKALTVNE